VNFALGGMWWGLENRSPADAGDSAGRKFEARRHYYDLKRATGSDKDPAGEGGRAALTRKGVRQERHSRMVLWFKKNQGLSRKVGRRGEHEVFAGDNPTPIKSGSPPLRKERKKNLERKVPQQKKFSASARS